MNGCYNTHVTKRRYLTDLIRLNMEKAAKQSVFLEEKINEYFKS